MKNAGNLRAKDQPTFIYDINKQWEKVVSKKPVWKSNNFPKLPKEKKYKFLGHDLISPIIIAAGASTGKFWSDFYFKMGFGGIIEKTKRSVYRPSNTAPNIAIIHADRKLSRKDIGKPLKASTDSEKFLEFQSITNSFGNPSSNLHQWAPLLPKQRKAKKDGQIFGCSVTATIGENSACSVILGENPPAALIVETAADLLMAASAAASTGAVDFLEFNLACPNVLENREEGEMFQNPKLVKYTLSEFKKRFPHIPVGFKFGLYKNKDQMRRVFATCGDSIDYVSGINAVANPVLAEDGSEILPGRATSGVCGWVLQDIALEAIEWASDIRKKEGLKYQILGGGGVLEPKDVDRFRRAGADCVQIATIALVNPLFAYEYHLTKQK